MQISMMTFHWKRFSAESNKAMGRFRIQLLLSDNTWSTVYKIPKTDRYSNSSTQCILLGLNFTLENFGTKLIHNKIDSAIADMSFSNILVTQSVYIWIM